MLNASNSKSRVKCNYPALGTISTVQFGENVQEFILLSQQGRKMSFGERLHDKHKAIFIIKEPANVSRDVLNCFLRSIKTTPHLCAEKKKERAANIFCLKER